MPATAETSSWPAVLEAFDRDLTRRAVAEKTRAAYGADCRHFAAWAREFDPAHPTEAAQVDIRTVRRYAAGLSAHGAAPATIARRLAALRGLFRSQMEIGAREDNPAELLSSPKQPQRLPRVLKATEVAALLDSIPASTPLELRDRALFELAYACGLRAEELVTLDLEAIDFDAESVRVEGKGGRLGWSRWESTRSARSSATWSAPVRHSRLKLAARPIARCSCRSPGAGCRPPTCGAG